MPNKMNQGHEIRPFVLLRVVKTIFFLNYKQGQGLRALVAISTQTFLKCPPPPGEDYIAEVAISVFLICARGTNGCWE